MVTRKAKAPVNPEDRMYTDIYDAVMEHRLPPKTKLTEQAFCEIYDLARHNVRKVLSRLADHGLVELAPNRGAFIASPSAQEANEMFELRQTLERLVIEKVAALDNTTSLKSLQALVQQERKAWESGDRASWIRLSADFHIELARLSGNELLTDMLQRLVSRTTLVIASHDAPGHNVCSFDEHLDILSHLKSGNKPAALKSMARHLLGCEHRVQGPQTDHFDLRHALKRP
jgi:DNA-binding GntR family transcriptional regulator